MKRDGCTQAIMEPLCEKSCCGEKWGINHSQAFGSWKKLFFVVPIGVYENSESLSQVYHSLLAFI